MTRPEATTSRAAGAAFFLFAAVLVFGLTLGDTSAEASLPRPANLAAPGVASPDAAAPEMEASRAVTRDLLDDVALNHALDAPPRLGFASSLELLAPEKKPPGFGLFSCAETRRCERTYARNNPLKYVDPDGRSATVVGGLIGGLVGGGIALVEGKSWREVGGAAAGGAIAGAMMGSVIDTGGGSLAAFAATGALGGATGGIVENLINGRATSVSEMALDGMAGATGVVAPSLVGVAIDRAVARAASREAAQFFVGTHYGDKVAKQMLLGDNHSFPLLVESNYARYGTVSTIKGGDGRTYSKLTIRGAYHGAEGVFTFIKNAAGEITERFFVKAQP